MTLLDRYVLRRHLGCLALSAVAMWLVSVVVDLIENIDTFIDHEASLRQIVRYYVFRTPYWLLLALPITTLLGTLFSLGGLARRSEIVAAKAAGISLHRLLAPLHLFSVFMAVAAIWFTDAIVPGATYRYNSTRNDIRSYSRTDGSRRQVLLQDVGGQFIFARSYDHQRRRAHEVTWERTDGSRTVERATSRVALWRPDPGRWVMTDGHYYQLDGPDLRVAPFDSLALTLLTLKPGDFARQQKKPEEMDYAELSGYIRRAKANGEDVTRHLVDLYLKISFPFTCVVIFLLGAPLGVATRRSGRASAFGLGVLICFVFYGSVKAGQALGWNGILSPWLGAWLVMFLFGGLGLLLLRRAHT
jgi:lipopolysaccharide export system permease protein